MKVILIYGSENDKPFMQPARDYLEAENLDHEEEVLSAHRNLSELIEYLGKLEESGEKAVILAIAGLAAAAEAARCSLKTALFDDGLLGGLITNVGSIHGHPDTEGGTGADLVNGMLGAALEAAGVSANVVSFNGVLTACARAQPSARVDDAMRVFASMEAAGVAASVVSYNALINACAKAGVVS